MPGSYRISGEFDIPSLNPLLGGRSGASGVMDRASVPSEYSLTIARKVSTKQVHTEALSVRVAFGRVVPCTEDRAPNFGMIPRLRGPR